MDENIPVNLPSLHEAVMRADIQTVQRLLQEGVSPDALIYKTAPLGIAARKGHMEVASLLLEAGCNVNRVDGEMQTPLFAATRRKDLPFVKLLLQYGADVSLKYMSGDLPIHEAIKQGSRDIFEVLLEAGSDPAAANNGGDTLLHMSAARGMHNIVQILLDAGCDPNTVKKEGPWQSRDTGLTPLHFAANIGHPMVCQVLLAGGANINAQTSNGRTPLHLAAMSQRGAKVMSLLISHGSDLNALSMEQEERKTPLLKAVDFQQAWAVQRLAEAGADINAVDHYGVSALMSSVFHENAEIVRILVQAGCDVNLESYNGQNPFHVTLSRTWSSSCISKMLILAGCDLSEESKSFIANVLPAMLTENQFTNNESVKEDVEWIIDAVENPCDLLHLARLVIRKCIDEMPSKVVHNLPLPQKLCNYLLLPELNDLESHHKNENPHLYSN